VVLFHTSKLIPTTMAQQQTPPYEVTDILKCGGLQLPPPEGDTSQLLAVSTDGSVGYVGDASAWANIGQPDGLATLDGAGYVPLAQLGNVPYTGVISSLQTQIQTINSNVSCVTSAVASIQASKGAPDGLATLDDTGNVPASQLNNAIHMTALNPWMESEWAADLAHQSDATSGATAMPVYVGAIDGGSTNIYFVATNESASQPYAIQISIDVARTVMLLLDPGNVPALPIVGAYVLSPGSYSITVPAPAFSYRTISSGTYVDQWSGSNSITYSTPTDVLGCYIGIGFPWGPSAYPPGSPFGIGYTLIGSPYLADGSSVKIRGWRNTSA
jgi:hypothetical protein